MNIYLIGFMGCGKSFWGKQIAQHKNIPFFDLDAVIEDIESMPVMDIFFDKGEEQFREIEHQALIDIIDNNNQYIISCGGGTPCFKNNLDLMNQTGITIYLKANETYLFERLRYEKLLRPLIHDLDNLELKNFIRTTLAQRSSFYEKAKYIIDVETCNLSTFTEILNNV